MSAAASAAGISFRLAASSSEPQPTQPATIVRVRVNDFRSSSSAWQGVFSAMTPKQVEAVSKEIVNEVAGR